MARPIGATPLPGPQRGKNLSCRQVCVTSLLHTLCLNPAIRSNAMGDKKGKKDKAKGLRQKQAKQAKAAQRKLDRRQPRTP